MRVHSDVFSFENAFREEKLNNSVEDSKLDSKLELQVEYFNIILFCFCKWNLCERSNIDRENIEKDWTINNRANWIKLNK